MKNLNDIDAPADTPVAPPPVLPQDEDSAPELALEPAPSVIDSLPLRFSCFVTGTDTEIGKTLVSSAILHKLASSGQRACGMKPVAAGAEMRDGQLHNDDADMLIAAGNEGVTIEAVPIIAAFAEIQAASDAVVVEGVGGFRVPFNDEFDSADLAAQLNLPVILVVGMRLGCISHALLTVEAIINRGLVLAGWVANTADPDMRFESENIAALAQRIPAPLLGHVPRLQEPTAAAAAAFIDLAGLPGWPSTRGQS